MSRFYSKSTKYCYDVTNNVNHGDFNNFDMFSVSLSIISLKIVSTLFMHFIYTSRARTAKWFEVSVFRSIMSHVVWCGFESHLMSIVVIIFLY